MLLKVQAAFYSIINFNLCINLQIFWRTIFPLKILVPCDNWNLRKKKLSDSNVSINMTRHRMVANLTVKYIKKFKEWKRKLYVLIWDCHKICSILTRETNQGREKKCWLLFNLIDFQYWVEHLLVWVVTDDLSKRYFWRMRRAGGGGRSKSFFPNSINISRFIFLDVAEEKALFFDNLIIKTTSYVEERC